MAPIRAITSSVILWTIIGLCAFCYATPTLVGVSNNDFFASDKESNLWGTLTRTGNSIHEYGDDGQYIVKFSGKRDNFFHTVYSSTLIQKLKPNGSNVSHNEQGYIGQVWPLPDGMVLFMVGVKNKNYLYKLNPLANTVGRNALQRYNNKEAVMNVGERYSYTEKKKIHYEDVRALHERSLLIATIAGKTVLFFAEYNVNANRIPGGAGDAVALWKSTTMGNSWRKVVEWNTAGVHNVDHIHGLKQNPYNGWIYMLFGDDNQEPGIVAWDGVSNPIPDNTPIADIGLKNKYPGWRVISGSQDVRAGDIVFTKDKCVWIPDIDYLGAGEFLYGQQANHDLTGLQATGRVSFSNGSSPIIAEIDAKGNIYWASFRSTFDYSVEPPRVTKKKIHVWVSTTSGLTWGKPILIPVDNDWTSVPQNLFISSWGDLILGGGGVMFGNHLSGTASSIYLRK